VICLIIKDHKQLLIWGIIIANRGVVLDNKGMSENLPHERNLTAHV
jgi:hypothetical protein